MMNKNVLLGNADLFEFKEFIRIFFPSIYPFYAEQHFLIRISLMIYVLSMQESNVCWISCVLYLITIMKRSKNVLIKGSEETTMVIKCKKMCWCTSFGNQIHK